MNPSAARVGPAYVTHPSGGQPQPANAPAVTSRPPASPYVPPTRVGAVNCPRCGKPATPGLPFCGHCGTLVGQRVSIEASSPAGTALFAAGRFASGPRLSLLG